MNENKEREERDELERDVSSAVMETADLVKTIMGTNMASLSPGQLTTILTACKIYNSVLKDAGF